MTRTHWLPLGLRWTARITGLAFVALFAVFAVGYGGLPNVVQQPVPVQIEFAGMFMMLAGFLAAWRWETFGGILATLRVRRLLHHRDGGKRNSARRFDPAVRNPRHSVSREPCDHEFITVTTDRFGVIFSWTATLAKSPRIH